MIKLVVFDLDDTLAPVGRGIAEHDLKLLKELEDMGVRIVLSSGKPTYYLCGLLRQLGLKHPIMIGENGIVIQFGVDLPPKKYYVLPYPEAAARSLVFLKEAIQEKLPGMWFQPNEVALTPFPTKEEEFRIINEIIEKNKERIEGITVYQHGDSFDFVPEGMNKGTGLLYLADLLGISMEETAAVGDGISDYAMFENAGFSVGIRLSQPEKAVICVNSITEALNTLLSAVRVLNVSEMPHEQY